MDMPTSNSNLQSVRIILHGTSCQKQTDNLLGPILFISATDYKIGKWKKQQWKNNCLLLTIKDGWHMHKPFSNQASKQKLLSLSKYTINAVWTMHSKNRYWCWHVTSSAQSLFQIWVQISPPYFHPCGDENVDHCIAQVRHISNHYHSRSNLIVLTRIAFYELTIIF